ncbi:hypothetical protein HY78_29020 (plasmid) [Rhizorhabdus wittichii DC-6]|nr:hypothetical protein HY78_29020 [Rhizorhabdus wittichii DC-6]
MTRGVDTAERAVSLNSETASPETLIQRAAELVPLLRENAVRCHNERRIPQENLSAIRQAGLLRMSRPRRYGGHEAMVATKTAVFGELARGCGSTAWVTTLYEDAAFLISLFPDEVQDEIFADPDTLVTATLIPAGKAQRQGDGFVVNGKWPFNTGCLDATYVVQPAVVDLSGGAPEVCLFLMPYSELVIEDDWFVVGLRGTGSNSVKAKDVYVRPERMLRLADVMQGIYGTKLNKGPLYRIPPIAFILSSAGATFPGLAKSAFELVTERLAGRPITYTLYADRTQAPVTHLQLAEAALKIKAADHLMAEVADRLDRRALNNELLAPDEGPMIWGIVGYTSRLYAEVIEALRQMSGASALSETSAIQAVARNAQALATHAMLIPSTGMEHYGRAICHLPPNTPFL